MNDEYDPPLACSCGNERLYWYEWCRNCLETEGFIINAGEEGTEE